MKISVDKLMKSRGGSSNNYDCPIHISPEACMKLYEEVGVKPKSGAVGALGDVLENFAIAVIKNSNTKTMSIKSLERSLNDIFNKNS